jgi:hypothetical protein
MERFVAIAKVMGLAGETILTFFILVTWGDVKEGMAITILFFTAFYWALRIKQLVQEQYFNSFWKAIKSLFKKRNKYGEK